jgi:hypothetical protein
VFHHFGQAAAILLLIELVILLIVFTAIAGGLAFGLYWARGKTGSAFGKVNDFLPVAVRYMHQGADYAAKPFILASGTAETIKGTAQAIRREASEGVSRPTAAGVTYSPPPPAEPPPVEPAATP